MLVQNLKRRDPLEDLDIDGMIMINEWDGRVCTDFMWHIKGISHGCSEHGNEPSDSIRGRE
jgi:hypothetical protein